MITPSSKNYSFDTSSSLLFLMMMIAHHYYSSKNQEVRIIDPLKITEKKEREREENKNIITKWFLD